MTAHATTIVAVMHNGKVAMAGDGQVTIENQIMKAGAKKVRRMHDGKVLAGIAGSVADAYTLSDKFEAKLEESHGNILRAVREFAKEWRTDRILRRLEALMIVADAEHVLVLSGSGEVIEPDDGIAAIGSGGGYALAAARALMRHSNLTAQQIVEEALRTAASICVYTNENITVEAL
ncbi:MAG: ATP-dependent protease subunit HslV [Armatimonadetes bacterium]|nr:ATP-dependent protease subunit HslV [Armatimonadota bacterium]